ncbi:MAG TPA: MlaE family lipid ABC transporter permease subunit [Gammaproteobacteria bacterium]|nr:MlaE family lipid ABC transporter permease subunit [Gammaproteobacteria bacterium]
MTAQAIVYDQETQQLICQGDWDLAHFSHLKHLLANIPWPSTGKVMVDGSAIKKMDSAGAWLLVSKQINLKERGVDIQLQNFSENQQTLLNIIQTKLKDKTDLPNIQILSSLAALGQNTLQRLNQFYTYLGFVGGLYIETLRIIRNPVRWRVESIATVIYRNGYQALPIIALLSFMIGVVITYQLGLQLRSYGANIYIIDLLGLSIFREFSPLLTAIMVAGRTGSSFTAQLGMMTINQEIDALDTMGVTPGELLILPRMIGLVISLPLLTMWADVFGVVGGMVMANNMLGITWHDFLARFPNVIPLRSFIIGIGKAPVFALIIASIGCFHGMSVERNADSVGRNTTRSVVLAIFFIIVVDAIFSIIFSELKL